MKHNNLLLTIDPSNLPWIIGIAVGAGVIAIALFVLLLVLHKKDKKPKRIKVDDEFTNSLVALLGGKENIEEVTVDNGRLKFKVKDLDSCNLNGIKEIATSGVFVTGNIIKTLFKLDSQIIKKAIEQII